MDSLVALEREGVPIFSVINSNTLPNFDAETLLKVGNLLVNATHEYYRHNIREGCTDPTATNFDFEVV